ncbi:type II secretion system F family protein, partial [Cellulomonas sp.]
MASKTFEYAVRDRSGKIVKGRVEASNQAAVANRLREMGMAAVSINEVSTGGLNAEIKIPGMSDKVSLKDIAVMSRQLATMISSGLSLLRALSILAEQTESKPLQRIVAQVRNDVETGVALSTSLGRHPQVFPPLMINMVKAG